MRKYSARKRTYMTEINMTPLIDVMLVLLVIFMVTAPLLTTGIDLTLPKSSASAEASEDNPIIVSITKTSEIYVGSNKSSINDIVQKISAIASGNKAPTIHLRGDQNVKYSFVIKVIGLINRAGFSKISLITTP